ncbi:hypothetical protein BJ508DRAFT_309915 [Ascobolus immersus RN42]|uniref:Uncharacterized protein n=1 Tax=Ascobolus immersus RN42 TaxID=1160509 RepID=A0A3N4HWV6_ASCIM|nr:hypothetical protein BJ508DRAFT_309915 [Ascobolus immersus RN42]
MKFMRLCVCTPYKGLICFELNRPLATGNGHTYIHQCAPNLHISLQGYSRQNQEIQILVKSRCESLEAVRSRPWKLGSPVPQRGRSKGGAEGGMDEAAKDCIWPYMYVRDPDQSSPAVRLFVGAIESDTGGERGTVYASAKESDS